MGANAQTSVPTFTAGQVLTAAQLNQSARTGVPVAADTTARDGLFGGTGEKTLAEGQLVYLEDSDVVQYYDGSVWKTLAPAVSAQAADSVATSQSTTSTSYTDLATAGPTVTLTTGTSAFVYIQAQRADEVRASFSFEVSGASSVSAGTYEMPASGSGGVGAVRSFEVTGLTAGSNTFTMKYKSDGTSQAFSQRTIFVATI
jgi:Tfp pilus assembly protein FimT